MLPGDVIVAIGDRKIADVAQLLSVVSGLQPGTAVRFSVARKKQLLDLQVTPGTRPRPKAQ